MPDHRAGENGLAHSIEGAIGPIAQKLLPGPLANAPLRPADLPCADCGHAVRPHVATRLRMADHWRCPVCFERWYAADNRRGRRARDTSRQTNDNRRQDQSPERYRVTVLDVHANGTPPETIATWLRLPVALVEQIIAEGQRRIG
jgi:hypothetical protein